MKTVGKWVITLTAPVWIVPAAVVAIVVLLFSGIHDSLWNHRNNRR